MAIFGFKKRKDEKLEQGAAAAKSVAKRAPAVRKAAVVSNTKVAKETKAIVPVSVAVSATASAAAIIRPRVTEKSGILSQSGVYTFEVARDANKNTVAKAMKAIYKVTPVKIAMINTPIKNIFVKGRKGTVPGMRKAIVTLAKGQKIDFV